MNREIPPTASRQRMLVSRLSGALRDRYSQRDIDAAVVALWGVGLSCGDGACVFGHPGGMHTNGGCRCGRNDPLTTLLQLQYLAERLDVAVEVSDEP